MWPNVFLVLEHRPRRKIRQRHLAVIAAVGARASENNVGVVLGSVVSDNYCDDGLSSSGGSNIARQLSVRFESVRLRVRLRGSSMTVLIMRY